MRRILGSCFIAVALVAVIGAPNPLSAQPGVVGPNPDSLAWDSLHPNLLTKIERPLLTYLRQAEANKYVSVLIIMRRQVTEAERRAAFLSLPPFSTRDSLKAARREVLVELLKATAQTEQAAVLDSLQTEETRGKARRIQPIWLVNAIAVELLPGAIAEVAPMQEIHSLHLDLPRMVTHGATWNVSQVNADDVWTRTPTSYKGDGVVVGIMDVGVDYDHPDLEGRLWINDAEDANKDGKFTPSDVDGTNGDTARNDYVDDVIGWEFDSAGTGDAKPDTDPAGHGTTVAGIVAGDGSRGENTGVAPGAKLMVLGLTEFITEGRCELAMQYALEMKADLLNASIAIKESDSPAHEAWRLSIENLMDGGVLFVTGAGNETFPGAPGEEILIPGRVPLAVTVAHLDASDVVSPEVNKGPVTWETILDPLHPGDCSAAGTPSRGDYPYPPGLQKPDLAAPGVDIRSTTPGTSYGGGTGSSFAAPHVTGVAALLLDEDSGLTPYELKFLLEETARDVGDAGTDLATGWGCVDALAAVNYDLDRTPFDLSITGADALWTTEDIWIQNDSDADPDEIAIGAENQLFARVKNIAGQVPSNVEVKFFYADVATTGTDGFDPNGDGDPSDGDFTCIGSYRIPTLGPVGSDHASAEAVVAWTPPDPGASHWCVGVGIIGSNSANGTESRTSNNTAFRNFFTLEPGESEFAFMLAPPAMGKKLPFVVEILRKNLPAEVVVELQAAPEIAPSVFRRVRGMKKIEPTDAGEVRYVLAETRGELRKVQSATGASLPVRFDIHVPDDKPRGTDGYITVNALTDKGARAGGFTIRIPANKATR